MELRTFVQAALNDIIGAVTDTHVKLKCPTSDQSQWKFREINFEVAVSASDKSGGTGGISVVAGLFSLTGAKLKSSEDTASAIIRFSVPAYLPALDSNQNSDG